MYLIPFIYFTLLTCYLWYRNRTVDVGVYMSALYAFTSFCAVIIVTENKLEGSGILFDGWEPQLGVMPTLLYCFLLTITIFPFTLIRPEKITNITNNHPTLLLVFTMILLAQSLLNLYLVADSTWEVLNGDLSSLRQSHYAGEMSIADIKASSLPGLLQYFNYLNYTTILALPLFFYYTCVEKRSLWITSVLLFVSISPVLKSLQAADRTETIFYAQMMLFCIVFFRRLISSPVKRLLLWAGVPVVGLSLIYIIAVSSARFDRTDEGTSGSVLQYAGQAYLNFCYFYDNANPNLFYPQREIPVISHVVFKSDYSDVKDERSAKEGFFIGVFATHVGAWLLDVGVVGCVLYSFGFSLLCLIIIKYLNRSKYDISEVLLLFIAASVPIFGIFYYRFHSFTFALQYVFAGILYLLSKYKFVWKKS